MEERERLECIERQVCEAEALLAIYEGDETLRVEFSGLDGAREALEAGSPTTELEEISMVLTFAGARDHARAPSTFGAHRRRSGARCSKVA